MEEVTPTAVISPPEWQKRLQDILPQREGDNRETENRIFGCKGWGEGRGEAEVLWSGQTAACGGQAVTFWKCSVCLRPTGARKWGKQGGEGRWGRDRETREAGRAFWPRISQSHKSSAWHDSGQGEHADKKDPISQSVRSALGMEWRHGRTPTRNARTLGDTVGSAGHTLSGCSPGPVVRPLQGKGLLRRGESTVTQEGSCRETHRPHAEGGHHGRSLSPSEVKDLWSSGLGTWRPAWHSFESRKLPTVLGFPRE